MHPTVGVSVFPLPEQSSHSEAIAHPSSDFLSLVEGLGAATSVEGFRNCFSVSAAIDEKHGVRRQPVLRVNELQVELYEQQVFAIHKLSYIDPICSIGASAGDENNAAAPIAAAHSSSGTTVISSYPSEAISHTMPAFTYPGSERNLSATVVDVDFAVCGKHYAKHWYPLDKTRLTISRERDQVLLIIRDHFSDEVDLHEEIRELVNKLDIDAPKVLLNGKEV